MIRSVVSSFAEISRRMNGGQLYGEACFARRFHIPRNEGEGAESYQQRLANKATYNGIMGFFVGLVVGSLVASALISGLQLNQGEKIALALGFGLGGPLIGFGIGYCGTYYYNQPPDEPGLLAAENDANAVVPRI